VKEVEFRIALNEGYFYWIQIEGHERPLAAFEFRFFGVILQQVAELANGGVDAVLGIDKDLAGPEVLGNLCASDKLTLARDKEDEQLHRLALDGQRMAAAEELESSAVELKLAELKDTTSRDIGDVSGQGTSSMRKYQTVCQETARFERGWRFT